TLSCPIGGQGAELVADVEAYVIALLEHDKFRRAARRTGQALALGHWNHFVAGAVHDEQRTFDPLRHTLEGEAARDLPRFLQRSGMAPDAESLLRGRGHCRQHGAEIERP